MALIGIFAIIKDRRWGMFVLGVSLFIQRYNLYIVSLNRSIQLSFIFIAVFIVRELFILFIEGYKSKIRGNLSKPTEFLKRAKTGILHVWKVLWANSLFRWLLLMWGTSAITLIWGYDRLQGVIELFLRALTFGTAFLVYWVNSSGVVFNPPKTVNSEIAPNDSKTVSAKQLIRNNNPQPITEYLFTGLIVGGLLDFALTLAQQFDCLWNSCQFFLKFDHVTLGIRGLSLTEQMLWFGDKPLFRSMGNFGDVNMHAFMMFALCILCVALLIRTVHKKSSEEKTNSVLLYGLVAVISFGVGVSCISRSAIFGLLVAIIFTVGLLWILWMITIKRWVKKIIVLLGTATVLVFVFYIGMVFYGKYVPKNIKEFVENRIDIEEEGSALRHFELIEEAYRIGGTDAGFIGIGVGSYYRYYQDNYNLADHDNDPHSWIAKQFAEEGVLGILVYLAFFVWIGVSLVKIFGNYVKAKQRGPFTELAATVLITAIPFMFLSGMVVYYGFYLPMVWVWVGGGLGKFRGVEFK
ncbi:hypothetical protein JW962_03435 [Candidatus Dojkabacteria bacterium]|nr:hypothetical protein [Candidatus Dojkabacteria bacterium]